MESYRNRNNLLYLHNANLKMYHQNMLFLHFSLPTPQSPQMEMTLSLGPRFQWLWCDQRKPLSLSVASLYLEQLHSPGVQNIMFADILFVKLYPKIQSVFLYLC